jgi:hypothetical protein
MNMVGALTYMHSKYLDSKETYEKALLEEEEAQNATGNEQETIST